MKVSNLTNQHSKEISAKTTQLIEKKDFFNNHLDFVVSQLQETTKQLEDSLELNDSFSLMIDCLKEENLQKDARNIDN